MKKYILMTSVLTFFLLAGAVSAHGMEIKPVESAVSDILSAQNMSNISQIDCNKISVLDFEDLGDAVMERMVGNHELHEQMDSMMGGEGSESLQAMHVSMGRNWLNCGGGFQGMMGSSGMMNVNMMPMMMRIMGNYYPGYYIGYSSLLVLAIAGWILSIILIALLILTVTGTIKIHKGRK